MTPTPRPTQDSPLLLPPEQQLLRLLLLLSPSDMASSPPDPFETWSEEVRLDWRPYWLLLVIHSLLLLPGTGTGMGAAAGFQPAPPAHAPTPPLTGPAKDGAATACDTCFSPATDCAAIPEPNRGKEDWACDWVLGCGVGVGGWAVDVGLAGGAGVEREHTAPVEKGVGTLAKLRSSPSYFRKVGVETNKLKLIKDRNSSSNEFSSCVDTPPNLA